MVYSFALFRDLQRLFHQSPSDTDQVERVSHAPSTVVSELESEPESPRSKMEQDEDVDMEDDSDIVPSKRQPKKRKAKAAIPIGKNGLKKRKVTKTRTTKKNGYIGTDIGIEYDC